MNSTLTNRERQVLELMAYGNSQKEVAYLLDCRVGTVDAHVKNIKRKTGLQKATELSCAWLWKKYRLPVLDIPVRTRKRIAAALLALSLFTVVFYSSEMVRVFRSGRRGETCVRVTARSGRRSRKDYELKLTA